MNPVKAIVFDLDGTLIDSSEGIINSVMETIGILGLEPLSREFVKSCIGPPIADSLGSKVGYTQSQIDEFYGVFRPIYRDKHLMECNIIDGIPELLSELRSKGFLLGVATNKREDYTGTLLDNLGLSKCFDSICAMDMEGKLRKTQILRNCISGLGVPPAEVMMVGDAGSDLKGATECGTGFIGVGYGYGFKGPDDVPAPYAFAGTVPELRDLFLTLPN